MSTHALHMRHVLLLLKGTEVSTGVSRAHLSAQPSCMLHRKVTYVSPSSYQPALVHLHFKANESITGLTISKEFWH